MKANKCTDCKISPISGGQISNTDVMFWLVCPKCNKRRGSIWSKDEAVKEWNKSNPRKE